MFDFFTPIEMLYVLIGAHFIADYPLQGDFLSKLKNRYQVLSQDMSPLIGLVGHAWIHATFVFAITGDFRLACAELLLHTVIDDLKCSKLISFNQDQFLHIFCKTIYVAILAIGA